MGFLGQLWTLVAAAALAVAAPARPMPRAVSSAVLGELTLFAEYAAASYCTNNINSTGNAVACSGDYCPLVQPDLFSSTDFGDVAGFFAVDPTNKLLVLSFRGSRTISTWIANLDFGATDASSLCDGCKAHSGFLKSWESVSDELTSQIASAKSTYPSYTLVLTGHSFGAAVAALGATALRNAGYDLDLYTYGQPRVGSTALAEYMTNQGVWRVTHTMDLVPRLPPASWGFSHASPEYWITSGNDVTVTTGDITEIVGVGSTAGNAGASGTSVEAHNWYIVHIDGCQ
ncbi:Lipase [Penicillium canariense]|uniref:Lipase n=1 Tax=Penicillium canariense TaxID=189055 RepID=A0A9W9IJ34_9EURO|nr:Lipase [Penicillium canariense]KAJ5177282.1 Lipase [Penicillium canariense]